MVAPVSKKCMELDDKVLFVFTKVAAFKVWP
jgi:hypothetical protein